MTILLFVHNNPEITPMYAHFQFDFRYGVDLVKLVLSIELIPKPSDSFGLRISLTILYTA